MRKVKCNHWRYEQEIHVNHTTSSFRWRPMFILQVHSPTPEFQNQQKIFSTIRNADISHITFHPTRTTSNSQFHSNIGIAHLSAAWTASLPATLRTLLDWGVSFPSQDLGRPMMNSSASYTTSITLLFAEVLYLKGKTKKHLNKPSVYLIFSYLE